MIISDFLFLCREHGLAATHQRRVIYETVMSLEGHPSPELIYDAVRKKIPSISLATVYKNVRTFLESGMLREVSMHHGSIRVEPNESTADIVEFYGRARVAADQVIDELELDSHGTDWNGETVSMRWVLIHMIEETARHAGHMDIVRELIDATTGYHPQT